MYFDKISKNVENLPKQILKNYETKNFWKISSNFPNIYIKFWKLAKIFWKFSNYESMPKNFENVS
jgi:hypothetical protein